MAKLGYITEAVCCVCGVLFFGTLLTLLGLMLFTPCSCGGH